MTQTRITFIFSLLMLIAHLVPAQHYAFRKQEGATPPLEMRNTKTVIKAPARENLSEWQSMPFDWSFYGQKVEGFYVSVNGYITFDKAASRSYSQPHSLPNPQGPKSAIFVCWADWHLEAGEQNTGSVITWVQGEAPNRILAITWLTLTPASLQEKTTSMTNLFLLIHENGDIETYSRSTLQGDFTAIAGIQNANATKAVQLTAAQLPHRSFKVNEDIIWLFEYSNQELKARVIETSLGESQRLGEEKEIQVSIWNSGSESIHSVTIAWQKEGTPLQRKQFKRLRIAANEFYPLNLGGWKAQEAGKLASMQFRVEEINGKKVESPAFEQKVFVNLGRSAPKKVLAESFTGTWCGWCPDGMIELKKLMAANDKVVAVAIHVRDAMEIRAGVELSEVFKPAYPEAMFNRTAWAKEPRVPVKRGNNAWFEYAQKALDIPSPVEIAIDHWFDAQSGKLKVKVHASFVDYALPGDLRFHLLIAEDEVTSEDPRFNQANYFSGIASFPDHPFFDAPSIIPGYVHHFLLRQAPSGAWGTGGIISPAPAPGDSFSFTYELEIPEHYVREKVSLLGFVSYYDENPGKRQLLNVQEKPLLPAPAL